MCPFTSLPGVEGPSRFSPSAVGEWQPRRKSVPNACERCRRRKIRCDGDTPCATCNRFSLTCVRSQKPKEQISSEHQAALESRIHQLEAQLAAHVSTPMHGMDSIDQSLMAGPANFGWQSQPQLTLDTNFSPPYSADNDLDFASFSAENIPSIAITECNSTPADVSPSSPVPSFWSGTTRASSPEMHPTSAPQFTSNIAPPTTTKTFSPPMVPHAAPSWEFLTQDTSNLLKPHVSHSRSASRRSSVSDFSLDTDMNAASLFPEFESQTNVPSVTSAPHLPRQGIFAPQADNPSGGKPNASFTNTSRAILSMPFPTKFEAETIISTFLSHVSTLEPMPYAITPSLFRQFFDIVYPDPARGASLNTPVSVRMVRFHIFLAMAIGIKIRAQGEAEENSLLKRCYELAMQQTSSAAFWQETGGVEAAQLLSVFASLGRESNFEPKSLQQSWSW
ncbi:hypothetical protein K469DRAFT_719700 [Zopfia rhizophila CBS 207.26]|uniref:Zn(2)-C6 fungal-type domain-containing protein n=1 Tax=Zopfia rhizophila CBS 207.26 TaxID=1314779 RepID=A0A6A6DJ78_9PEZI|nr:hypothetical protein K469DRAFT_719700 [Zopfia rhizophila CBS 207.26]